MCKLAEETRTANAMLALPGLLRTREQRVDGLARMKMFPRMQFGKQRQHAANKNCSRPCYPDLTRSLLKNEGGEDGQSVPTKRRP